MAIQVLPGTYADALEITRDTEIVGDERSAVVLTGTVHNAGAHSLRITRLTFRNTLSPAAIDVRHAEARTLVDHVTIEGARDGAIRHVGGALTAISVAINGTVTTPASPRRGAALRFEDASGSVALSSVSGGDAQALVIRGAAAHVEVNGFDVTDISMLERFRAAASVGASESAVVEVGGQARARLIGLGVTRAMIGGLTVRDGAEVRAEALSVLDTRDFATPPHTNTPFGVAVIDATAQFVDFRIDQSALIGMGLAGAQVTVGPGEIHNSRIGLWLTRAPANWDLDDCFYSVGTGGTNEVDIEMSTLPIPDISAAMGIDMANPTAPPAACPTVLWP